MIKIINYFLQSLLIYFFFLFGFITRLNIGRKIFGNLFSIFGPFFKSEKIINNNLDIFLKNFPEFNKNEIIKKMWKNYGMTFIEYVYLNKFKSHNLHMVIKGKDTLASIIKEKKPVIFVSGHFANFELMSMEITKNDIPLATIYRPLNNIFLNPFMEYLRKKYICKNQIKKGIKGVKKTIEYINNNNSIALMIDQRVSEGERINFFKEPALTTTLPAQLSSKFEMDIIPVFIERNTNNSFNIEFQKRINPTSFKNKLELSEELNKVIEKMIVKNPYQWIWTHNRWK